MLCNAPPLHYSSRFPHECKTPKAPSGGRSELGSLGLESFFPVLSHQSRYSGKDTTHSLSLLPLARIFHELLSRDHEDGRATGQPQGVGFRT
jgi:hypothetical protein